MLLHLRLNFYFLNNINNSSTKAQDDYFSQMYFFKVSKARM